MSCEKKEKMGAQHSCGIEENWAMGQGTIVTRLKTIGRGRGGHSCKPNPYWIMVKKYYSLKLVKAAAGLEK